MRKSVLMDVIVAPIVSEKSTLNAEQSKTLAFQVKKTASKDQVKRAIELLFKVEVDTVRTLNVQGKSKRFGRSIGRRSDWKKAYVKLKPGFDIDLSVA